MWKYAFLEQAADVVQACLGGILRWCGPVLKDQIVLVVDLLERLDQLWKIEVIPIRSHPPHIRDVHLTNQFSRPKDLLTELCLPIGVQVDGIQLKPEGGAMEGADKDISMIL